MDVPKNEKAAQRQSPPLSEDAKRQKRLLALEKLVAMGERGDFDILLDKRNYRW